MHCLVRCVSLVCRPRLEFCPTMFEMKPIGYVESVRAVVEDDFIAVAPWL